MFRACAEYLAPNGIRYPEGPARSKSYQLSYPGPQHFMYVWRYGLFYGPGLYSAEGLGDGWFGRKGPVATVGCWRRDTVIWPDGRNQAVGTSDSISIHTGTSEFKSENSQVLGTCSFSVSCPAYGQCVNGFILGTPSFGMWRRFEWWVLYRRFSGGSIYL